MAMNKESLFSKFGPDSPHLKVNIFNNYRIIGLLEEISMVSTKGCLYILNYNHTNHQYYLIKKFSSGKFHIDFFKNEEGVPMGILFSFERDLNWLTQEDYLLAKATGYDGKTLHFNFSTKKYFAKWNANGQNYRLDF